MYYLLFAFLYLISLLPFFVLYRVSDFAFLFLYYFPGYRKKVVMHNLEIAFPEKSLKERKRIARSFYRNLTDTFIETIKLLSIPDRQFSRRAVMNMDECNKLAATGKNLQFHSGHQMNWEYANLVLSRNLKIPAVKVYLKINNKAINRIFLKLRSGYNGIMISAQTFKSEIRSFSSKQHALALVADQSPPNGRLGHWLYFFNRPAAFLTGPDKSARKDNMAVVFVNFVKIKRGYYKFEPEIIAENGNVFKEGELTALYRDFLEQCIRKQPDNYLWTHRRWKFDYKKEYEKRWMDRIPAEINS